MDITDAKQALLNKLEQMEGSYNPEVRLLRTAFESPGYHTALKNKDYIHGTFKSFLYALALLDSGREAWRQRAEDILGQLLELQDRDRSRQTFGIWPWFYEETLDEMSPPDWNWADFCGKILILAEIRHGSRLSVNLRERMKTAIYYACDAIIKRNVGPNYTNISIMGAFVTLVAGEYYKEPEYARYGRKRLAKFYAYTKQLNTFQEYNSPNYATISILELSRILTHARNSEAIQMSRELLDIAWEMVARHYHPPTRQWAGPHSRSYSTLLTDRTRSFLQWAAGDRLSFVSDEQLDFETEWYQNDVWCPDFCISLFQSVDEGTSEQVFQVTDRGEERRASSYATSQWTLGTFNQGTMWNQSRAMIGYVKQDTGTTYLNLRCLHDGYDYCSAMFHSEQAEGEVLAGISFLTNGGDTHPNLDRIDGSIEATDFRLRLEVGGALGGVQASTTGKEAEIRIGNQTVRLMLWHAIFGEERSGDFRYEISETSGMLAVDVVLYSGGRRRLDFRRMDQALLVFSCKLGGDPQIEPVHSLGDHKELTLTWNKGHGLVLPFKPVEL